MTKMTKRDYFNSLRTLVLDSASAGSLENDVATGMVDFIEHELELLDKRAAKAKTYAKKAKADPMADAIYDIVANAEEALSAEDILSKLDESLDATKAKVSARCSAFVRSEAFAKDTVSVKEEGKAARKLTVYTLAQHDCGCVGECTCETETTCECEGECTCGADA